MPTAYRGADLTTRHWSALNVGERQPERYISVSFNSRERYYIYIYIYNIYILYTLYVCVSVCECVIVCLKSVTTSVLALDI